MDGSRPVGLGLKTITILMVMAYALASGTARAENDYSLRIGTFNAKLFNPLGEAPPIIWYPPTLVFVEEAGDVAPRGSTTHVHLAHLTQFRQATTPGATVSQRQRLHTIQKT